MEVGEGIRDGVSGKMRLAEAMGGVGEECF